MVYLQVVFNSFFYPYKWAIESLSDEYQTATTIPKPIFFVLDRYHDIIFAYGECCQW